MLPVEEDVRDVGDAGEERGQQSAAQTELHRRRDDRDVVEALVDLMKDDPVERRRQMQRRDRKRRCCHAEGVSCGRSLNLHPN